MELTMADVKERWGSFEVYTNPPMRPRLTGLGVEYVVLEAYSRDAGQRSAKLAFNVGQGTQDIGFRNDILVLFTAAPARDITLRIKNENGERAMASFVVRDRQGRLYPNPAKRLEPDFPFQPQVYRYDGEKLRLPDGYYTIQYTGGPEYYTRTKELPVAANGPRELDFQLQRWIDPSKYGWWSGDHHVHASGCAHYKNPTEGVEPEAMMRQALGENLNISSVLTWGPSWYHQKQYFSGTDNELSKTDRLMHYDVEVSGFPSSHAGHLVLLGLKEDDYPHTVKIEEWPSWDLPVLKWGKSQDAITGFSHSGWGLEVRTDELPNYEMPGFDGIGANEYVVDVTDPDTIDFISAVDTPAIWELNVWYHTLNVGFRTRISGETDFPCIYQEKVGLGRSYVKLDDLSYRNWIEGIRRRRDLRQRREVAPDRLCGQRHGDRSERRGAAAGRAREGQGDDEGRRHVARARRPKIRHAALRPETLLGRGTGARRRRARGSGGDHRERQGGGDQERRGRRAGARDGVRGSDRAVELGGRADSLLLAYQSDVRRGGRQTDSSVQAQRGVVPGGGESVLDAEGAADSGGGDRGGAQGLRSCARSVQAEDGREPVRNSKEILTTNEEISCCSQSHMSCRVDGISRLRQLRAGAVGRLEGTRSRKIRRRLSSDRKVKRISRFPVGGEVTYTVDGNKVTVKIEDEELVLTLGDDGALTGPESRV